MTWSSTTAHTLSTPPQLPSSRDHGSPGHPDRRPFTGGGIPRRRLLGVSTREPPLNTSPLFDTELHARLSTLVVELVLDSRGLCMAIHCEVGLLMYCNPASPHNFLKKSCHCHRSINNVTILSTYVGRTDVYTILYSVQCYALHWTDNRANREMKQCSAQFQRCVVLCTVL